MLLTWAGGFKAPPASNWLPKMLRLKSSLTVKNGYTLDSHKRTQTILLKHQMSVLRPDNDIANSMYEGRNVLAPQTVKQLRLRSSLTVKKRYTLDQSIASPALYWQPKILCLRSSLTIRKKYTVLKQGVLRSGQKLVLVEKIRGPAVGLETSPS